MAADKADAYDTLYTVLVTLLGVAAPLLPLLSEEMYGALAGGSSIHLTDWPDASTLPDDPNLVARMLTTQGSQDLAVRHLEQAYAVATSEAARTQIREKLAQLRGKQVAEDLAEKQHEFQAMINSRYPDFSEAFSLVIGPRITSNSILAAPVRSTTQHEPSEL